MKLSALDKAAGLITLDDILSVDREDSLKSIFSEAIQRGMKNVILDFSPLNHMNSAGASTLVKLAVLAKRQKMRLCAFRLNKRYQEIFDLTGLSEGITKFNETADELEGLSKAEVHQLKEMTVGEGEQDDMGWAPNIVRLQAAEKPQGAMNKNVNGRRLTGPLQGFGPIWQKTYLLTINKSELQPRDVITIMKQHLPEFQPSQNKFYPSAKGIAAGEIVLIDSSTPGGILSTGVLVVYADDFSFTLMTPQGHPEAGWVTFSSEKKGSAVEMRIQGLASAGDPFYELAFRIVGSKLQETIWKHVLSSLASYLGVEADVQMIKTSISGKLQFMKTSNLWYNAQIRSIPYNILRYF